MKKWRWTKTIEVEAESKAKAQCLVDTLHGPAGDRHREAARHVMRVDNELREIELVPSEGGKE